MIAHELWDKNSSPFALIKLHGSYGWKSSTDDSDVMVIGHTKTAVIKREPFLKWFFSLFVEALHSGDRKLAIMGYGFRDEHINLIIAEGIRNHGLRWCFRHPLLVRLA
jgi:SIR2-like domain